MITWVAAFFIILALTGCGRTGPPAAKSLPPIEQTIRMAGPPPMAVPFEPPRSDQSYATATAVELSLHEAFDEIRSKGLLSLVKGIERCYADLPEGALADLERCVAMDFIGHLYSHRLSEEGVPVVDYFERSRFLNRVMDQYRRNNHPVHASRLSMSFIEGTAKEFFEEPVTVRDRESSDVYIR